MAGCSLFRRRNEIFFNEKIKYVAVQSTVHATFAHGTAYAVFSNFFPIIFSLVSFRFVLFLSNKRFIYFLNYEWAVNSFGKYKMGCKVFETFNASGI